MLWNYIKEYILTIVLALVLGSILAYYLWPELQYLDAAFHAVTSVFD